MSEEAKHICWRCGGKIKGWWGTDGHSGRERFWNCTKCGVSA